MVIPGDRLQLFGAQVLKDGPGGLGKSFHGGIGLCV